MAPRGLPCRRGTGSPIDPTAKCSETRRAHGGNIRSHKVFSSIHSMKPAVVLGYVHCVGSTVSGPALPQRPQDGHVRIERLAQAICGGHESKRPRRSPASWDTASRGRSMRACRRGLWPIQGRLVRNPDAVLERDFELEKAVLCQQWHDGVALAEMKIHFWYCPVRFRRGEEDVECPVVPASADRTTLQRIAAVGDDPPATPGYDITGRTSIASSSRLSRARRPGISTERRPRRGGQGCKALQPSGSN
jgi:hypothetical protein